MDAFHNRRIRIDWIRRPLHADISASDSSIDVLLSNVTVYYGVEVGCTLLLYYIPNHTATYSLNSIHRLFFVIYVMDCMYMNCCDDLYLECSAIIPW